MKGGELLKGIPQVRVYLKWVLVFRKWKNEKIKKNESIIFDIENHQDII